MISDLDSVGNLKSLSGEERKFKGKKINEGGLLTQHNNIRFIYINSETGEQVFDEATRAKLKRQARLYRYIFLPNGFRTEGFLTMIEDEEVRRSLVEERADFKKQFNFWTNEYPKSYDVYKNFASGNVNPNYVEPDPDIESVFQIVLISNLGDESKKILELLDVGMNYIERLKDEEVNKFMDENIPIKQRIVAFNKINNKVEKWYDNGGPPGSNGKYTIVRIEPPYGYKKWMATEAGKEGYTIPAGLMYRIGSIGFFKNKTMDELFREKVTTREEKLKKARYKYEQKQIGKALLARKEFEPLVVKKKVLTKELLEEDKIPEGELLPNKVLARLKKERERREDLQRRINAKREKEKAEEERLKKKAERDRELRRKINARIPLDSDEEDEFFFD